MTSYGLDVLSPDECAALLQGHTFGRVAVWSNGDPAVFPVLYGVLDGTIVFRTAPGEKLVAAVLGDQVVFEIDEADPHQHTGWSVNVVGHAERLVRAVDIERAESLVIEPWAGEWRNDYVRIRPDKITGRRIRASTATVTGR